MNRRRGPELDREVPITTKERTYDWLVKLCFLLLLADLLWLGIALEPFIAAHPNGDAALGFSEIVSTAPQLTILLFGLMNLMAFSSLRNKEYHMQYRLFYHLPPDEDV